MGLCRKRNDHIFIRSGKTYFGTSIKLCLSRAGGFFPDGKYRDLLRGEFLPPPHQFHTFNYGCRNHCWGYNLHPAF